jgi:hypothetical protein
MLSKRRVEFLVTVFLTESKSGAVGTYIEDHVETKSWTSLGWHDRYELNMSGLPEFTKLFGCYVTSKYLQVVYEISSVKHTPN